MKVLNAGFGLMTSALTKIIGAQVLKDTQTFVTAFDTMFGGFRSAPSGPTGYCRRRAPRSSSSPRPSPMRSARPRTSWNGSTLSGCRWPGSS